MYSKKSIFSGLMLETVKSVKMSRPSGQRKRRGETPEDQKKRNEAAKRKELERKLNANFKNGDHFLTLTYAEEPEQAEAEKDIARFFRRLRRKYKEGAKRYIYTMERGKVNGRIHFHVLLPQEIELPAIISAWEDMGIINDRPIYTAPFFDKLAEYILKGEKAFGKKAYICGSGIAQPETKEETVKAKSFRAKPAETVKVKGRVYTLYDWEEHADPFTMDKVQTAVYYCLTSETAKKKGREKQNGKDKRRERTGQKEGRQASV